MQGFAAVDIKRQEAHVVAFGLEPKIEFLGTTTLSFPTEELEEDPEEQTTKVDESPVDIADTFEREFDYISAILGDCPLHYSKNALPFRDPKKVEKVLPLEIQDSVPFDMDDFAHAHIAMEQLEGMEQLLSALAPKQQLRESLEQVARSGVDPQLLTTKGFALAALKSLLEEEIENVLFLAMDEDGYVLAAYVRGSLYALREVGFTEDSNATHIIAEIRRFIARLIRDTSESDFIVRFIGSQEDALKLASHIPNHPIVALDLNNYIDGDEDMNLYWWAVGLAVAHKEGTPVLQLRRGEHAFKPRWTNFFAALKEESFNVAGAFLMFLVWAISTLYSSSAELKEIEDHMSSTIQQVLPDESVPKGQEIEFITNRVNELENQLRGMGTLSSLSPLDTIKQLSLTISAGIDTEIESLNVGSSRVSLRGSTPDLPSIGRLETALRQQNDRFCSVKIQPQGQSFGSKRNRFTADIQLCE